MKEMEVSLKCVKCQVEGHSSLRGQLGCVSLVLSCVSKAVCLPNFVLMPCFPGSVHLQLQHLHSGGRLQHLQFLLGG